MTSLFAVRRRAEDFAAAVDGSADPRAAGPELDGLAGVVTLLREHEQPTPRPEFVADLRAQLLAEAATALQPGSTRLLLPERPRGRRERALVAATTTAVLVGGTASMAAAAQDALPGELLYPVKRGIERVQAELSLSTSGKGQDLLSAASDRLTEVDRLVASDAVGTSELVPGTLDDFVSQAQTGSDLMFDSYTRTRDPENVVTVRTFASESVAELAELADEVPAEAQDELLEAAVALRDIDAAAAALCGSCGADLVDLRVPGILLARAEVDRALKAVSSDELDNSHPVVVPRTSDAAGAAGDDGSTGGAAAPRAGKDTGAAETDDPAVTSAGGVGDALPEADQPAPAEPGNLLDPDGGLLPEAGVEAEAPSAPEVQEDLSDAVEDTADVVDDSTGLLDDAVQTILPDTLGDGLLD